MAKLAVRVSLIKQDHPDHCTGILTLYAEELDSLRVFRARTVSHIGKPVALTYRNVPVNEDAQLLQYAPASAAVARFSATYKEPQKHPENAFVVNICFYGDKPEQEDTMTVIARSHTRIGALEKVIQARRGIEIADQRLLFYGSRLNSFFTFAQIEFAPNDTIDCVPPQMGAGAAFVDISDSSNLDVISFSARAPKWRMARPGLNVEGVCTDSSCEAYQQMVIATIGMTS